MTTPWTSSRNRPVNKPSIPRHCYVCGAWLDEGRLRLCGSEVCRDGYNSAHLPYPETRFECLPMGGKKARNYIPQ